MQQHFPLAESKLGHLHHHPHTLSYEEYLDSQISGTDMYYLENIELARQLVELGCV